MITKKFITKLAIAFALLDGATAILANASETALTINTVAHANTVTKKYIWHKGTPKELRGNYQIIHNAKHPLSPKYFWAFWTITAKQVNFDEMNWPTRLGYKVRYRYIGPHRYELKYNIQKNGYIVGTKNYRSYLGKKGKNLISYANNYTTKGNVYHKAKKR